VLALKMEEAALGERGVRFVGIAHKVRQLRGRYIAYVEPLSFKLAAWKVAAGAVAGTLSLMAAQGRLTTAPPQKPPT
jgi:hypothetical protein